MCSEAFALFAGSDIFTDLGSKAGSGAPRLSVRECVTAIMMIQFLLRRAEYIEEAGREVASFQPILPQELSMSIKELCSTLGSYLRDQPGFKDTICPHLNISCPICEEELITVAAADLDFSTTNKAGISSLQYENGIRCEHCSVVVDKCCFTLLPYLSCSIDENVGATSSVPPLKCRSCGAVCNASRRCSSVSGDDSNVEYCWLAENSPRDDGIYYCLYCSIPLLPSFS